MNLRPALAHDPWCVETATEADIPRLCDLLTELFSQEADFKPNRNKQAQGLSLILKAPCMGRIFLVRHEAVAFGMINVLTSFSPRHGGVAVWFEDLVVLGAFRGRGAASALLRHAIAFARAMDARQVTLLTDCSNQRAIRLYQRHGFAISTLSTMRLAGSTRFA